MTQQIALKVLQEYQKWRRDEREEGDIIPLPMPHPQIIGIALDVAIEVLKQLNNEAKEETK